MSNRALRWKALDLSKADDGHDRDPRIGSDIASVRKAVSLMLMIDVTDHCQVHCCRCYSGCRGKRQ